MGNLKYDAAIIDLKCLDDIRSLTTPKLQEVADAFMANVERVSSLLMLPAAAYHYSMMVSAARLQARLELIGPIDSLEATIDDEGKASEITQNQWKLLAGWLSSKAGDPGFPQEKWMQFANILDRTNNIFSFTVIEQGIEASYSGSILGTWTAFETLAGDIWEIAINERPEVLLKANAKTDKSNPPSSGDPRQGSVSLKIEIGKLNDNKFNVSKSIGSIYRNNRDYTFDNYDRICIAYKQGFSKVFRSLDTEQDRSLFNLAQTRNVIVHKAAIADKQFLDAMVNTRSSIPQFADLKEKDQIPVDGEVVQNLVGNAIRSSVRLINDVDSWVEGDVKK